MTMERVSERTRSDLRLDSTDHPSTNVVEPLGAGAPSGTWSAVVPTPTEHNIPPT